MSNLIAGHRPDLTPAQITAVLVAGVPVVATLLTAFGLAAPTAEQQDALARALAWGGVLAGLLIGGDATLRTARNVVDARRDCARIAATTSPSASLVEDEEEFHVVAELEARLTADDPDLRGSEVA